MRRSKVRRSKPSEKERDRRRKKEIERGKKR